MVTDLDSRSLQTRVGTLCPPHPIHTRNPEANTSRVKLDYMHMSSKRYKPAKTYRDFYAKQLSLKRNPTLPIDRSLIKDYVVNKGSSYLSN